MVPRTARMSFGVDPSAGPDEAIYSTPLMLRWIARCTSDWIRSGIDVRSRPAGAFISALHRRTADAWCAAGLGGAGSRRGVDARSGPAGAFISALHRRTADVWCAAVLAGPDIRRRARRRCSAAAAP